MMTVGEGGGGHDETPFVATLPTSNAADLSSRSATDRFLCTLERVDRSASPARDAGWRQVRRVIGTCGPPPGYRDGMR
jgi:hypothetical protein